ncbi:MAG: HAMP domain-containing protein, partial [Rhodoferax sp.]|uniref:methyl-accepting chemotaxis protein n=1 Tax=Rhodoferax sp. TaxID=50421 RepID=UPI0013FE55E3
GGGVYTDEITNAVSSLRNTYAIIGTLLNALLASLLYLVIRQMVSRPLANATRAAQQIASGDLTTSIKSTGRDEIGQLAAAMNGISQDLASVVSKVRLGTDTMALASGEIAAGNADLSSRTETQASSLEETASSMEQLTGTVRQNADNARQANQLAATASSVAIKGGAVVSQVVDTMGSIKASSRKIADIISVIDGIAFQTNILALNAAVEAARAGEQGRGFAVVATEVRNLAQRSASAAKEIKSLIDDSVQQVDRGSKLVDDAGQTMSEVVSSVKRVADIMSEITAASQEQSDGIEQVNQAIGQMDEVTQQNAALVEQAAAAAESLQDQAAALAQAVSVFKLGSETQPESGRPGLPGPHIPALAAKIPAAARTVAMTKTIAPKAVAKPGSKPAGADSDEWEEF